jgi:REP element-mobilizing transposase RayT
MIIGYHLIWTAYGWWLPNDPRGSSSHEIRVERVADLGELHHGRKIIQPPSAEIRRFYEQARRVLKHGLLTFDDDAILLIGQSLGRVVRDKGYTCYAGAVMPDHVHMLIRRHRDHGETMITYFRDASRADLIAAGKRPPEHPVWGGPGWNVFQETRDDMERTVRYVRDNPLKLHRPEQVWAFVRPYNGWLPAYRPNVSRS